MINNVKGTTGFNQNYELKEKQDNKNAEATQSKDEQAAVLELGKSSGSNATYSKPKVKNADEINRLWEETQKSYNTLRKLVEDLLAKQGKKFEDVLAGKEVLLVDEQTRAAAAAAVSDDGELGVKAVSDRIVSFAKAISGDDNSKAGELRNAIIKGFKEAEKALGGKLPEISQRTYDEVMKQLDQWEQEAE